MSDLPLSDHTVWSAEDWLDTKDWPELCAPIGSDPAARESVALVLEDLEGAAHSNEQFVCDIEDMLERLFGNYRLEIAD